MDNKKDRRDYIDYDEEEFAGMNREKCSYEDEREYDNRERDCFAEALEEAFNEGYKKGYCKGYEEGYEKGYCEGYKEGVKDGLEKAKEEILEFIKRKRCCCKRRKFKCC